MLTSCLVSSTGVSSRRSPPQRPAVLSDPHSGVPGRRGHQPPGTVRSGRILTSPLRPLGNGEHCAVRRRGVELRTTHSYH